MIPPSKPPAGTRLDRASPHCRGVVAFWAMNEGAGSRLNDLSGLGNDLLFDTVQPIRRGAAWGHGVATDGTDDQRATNTYGRGVPSAASPWTIEVRLSIAANNDNNFMAGFGAYSGASDGAARYFWVNNGNYGFYAEGFGNDWNTSGVAVDTDGKPHHLILTYNGEAVGGGTVSLYRDGVFRASVARNFTTPAATYALGGNHSGANGTLTARYDFACIRNVCLSAGEVAARYADPHGVFAPPPLRRTWMTVGVTATPPVAAFSGTPLAGSAPLSVAFTDESTNTPTSWLWEKNDGGGWANFAGTPTAQNPTEEFAAGTWSVRLTATNAGGSDGETKTDYVTVEEPPAPAGTASPRISLGLGLGL